MNQPISAQNAAYLDLSTVVFRMKYHRTPFLTMHRSIKTTKKMTYTHPMDTTPIAVHPQLQQLKIGQHLEIFYPLESVAAGFPSPAQDYTERTIDLNTFLIRNPPATFLVRVESLSMQNIGIEIGDHILIDRSLQPQHGDIVLALINNEFTVKRFMYEQPPQHGNSTQAKVWLKAENTAFPDIYPHSAEQLEIWGVVTFILKKLK
ncbi:DNA polymerase V [Acinetobacter calcoaceticus]|uniref:DNA polymerase V n=1 Tax=Acinetobacter calcoaceticus TaxID=471 RepID=A0A4R1XT72_ACICA|nr:DNA polymerase V [Acinetobacter calcoaceticus]